MPECVLSDDVRNQIDALTMVQLCHDIHRLHCLYSRRAFVASHGPLPVLLAAEAAVPYAFKLFCETKYGVVSCVCHML